MLSLIKFVIFCCRNYPLTACTWHFPLHCLYLTHFKMTDLTKELHLVTRRPEDLIWCIVHSQPASATCSWHQRTSILAILQGFSNIIGSCISFVVLTFLWILSSTLDISSSPSNEPNFTMLLRGFKHLFSWGDYFVYKVSFLNRSDYLLFYNLYSFKIQRCDTMLLYAIPLFERSIISYFIQSETQRGYLKCSIWGTNNQLPNMF